MEISYEEMDKKLTSILENNILKIVVSNPFLKSNKFKKITIENKLDRYLVSSFTEKQCFTKNIKKEELLDFLSSLKETFKQFNIFSDSYEFVFKTTKKGKIFFNKTKSQAKINLTNSNNRIKNYIFNEGEIIEPLIDMGIYTSDGKVVKSMYDKFKQINRFIELIDDYIKDSKLTKINIVDFGCGKSYLTFVVYYYFKFIRKIDINMVGLDLKKEVIEKCNLTAKKYGYDTLTFELGDINGYQPKTDIDMIITLHACDTATDYALFNAINWNVKMIFSVPCCQHEINKQISSPQLPIITRYGLIKERISSDLTDIVRCNILRAMSYQVEMIEFVGFEHTSKNILIRANLTKIPKDKRKIYLKEVDDLKNYFNFNQTLYKLLENKFIEQKLI